jgi:hypothetical protein
MGHFPPDARRRLAYHVDVRNGSFADIPGAKRNVCFTPKSRHRLVVGYSLCGLVAAGEEA